MDKAMPRTERLRNMRERLAWLQFEIHDINHQVADLLNGRQGGSGPQPPTR
jgi:hypothetical protein